jgi:hypothetical protein
MKISWQEIKDIKLSKNIPFNHVELTTRYIIWITHNNLMFTCELLRTTTDTTDLSDWETNFKSDSL